MKLNLRVAILGGAFYSSEYLEDALPLWEGFFLQVHQSFSEIQLKKFKTDLIQLVLAEGCSKALRLEACSSCAVLMIVSHT